MNCACIATESSVRCKMPKIWFRRRCCAWRRLETFEQRASVRAWLYKIATNACLDALDKQRRTLPHFATPNGVQGREPVWLEPCPDDWFNDVESSPEARYSARESLSLAFLVALQLLPPRQRAIL